MSARSYLSASFLLISIIPTMAIDGFPYGIEAVTQYRSEYNYRGFTVADSTTSFQLGTRYALDDSSHLNAAFWHDAETGDGDFSEAGALFEFGKDIGDASFGLSSTFRSYSGTFLESGVNLEANLRYALAEDLNLKSSIAYDTGAEGTYSELGLEYYHRINDSSFVNLSSGVSYVSDYYQLSGFNNAFAKLSYTFNINQSVSISPYIGTSILLDNDALRSDSLFGGIYFAVSF